MSSILQQIAKTSLIRKAYKWGQPVRNVIGDYIEVSKDVLQDARKSPIKSFSLLIFGGIMTFLHIKCPKLKDYQTELIEYANEIGLCAEATRNPGAKVYIDHTSALLNDGRLRFLNFGIFSIIMQRPGSMYCTNYHEVCAYVQPRLWTFHQRVVDVGVWGEWVLLKNEMTDFDVNEKFL